MQAFIHRVFPFAINIQASVILDFDKSSGLNRFLQNILPLSLFCLCTKEPVRDLVQRPPPGAMPRGKKAKLAMAQIACLQICRMQCSWTRQCSRLCWRLAGGNQQQLLPQVASQRKNTNQLLIILFHSCC